MAEFEVYGQAANPSGGEQTKAFECEEMTLGDRTIPPRVYYCPLYLDHGGSYVFTAIVNQARASTVHRAAMDWARHAS